MINVMRASWCSTVMSYEPCFNELTDFYTTNNLFIFLTKTKSEFCWNWLFINYSSMAACCQWNVLILQHVSFKLLIWNFSIGGATSSEDSCILVSEKLSSSLQWCRVNRLVRAMSRKTCGGNKSCVWRTLSGVSTGALCTVGSYDRTTVRAMKYESRRR